MDHKDELAQNLSLLLSTITTENPLEFFNDMYKSINPHCIRIAKEEAKKLLEKQTSKSSKDDKLVNVYFTLGGDSINRFLMEGIIATLLWLPYYVQDVEEVFKIPHEDVLTTIKVLNSIMLPKVMDAKDINNGEQKETASNCRHYASFLIAIIRWLTTGITMFHNTGESRTNMELVRYLTATALNTFPSVPYCAYFLGQTKTPDMANLTETLAKQIYPTLQDLMTKDAYQINSPKIVVQTQDAPLVGISGHPLGELYVGMLDDTTKKTEWLGVFVKSEQFEQLCAEHGMSVNEVHEYVMGISKAQHMKILQDKKHDKHSIAEFIEKQGNELIKTGFELFHKNDDKYYVKDDDFY